MMQGKIILSILFLNFLVSENEIIELKDVYLGEGIIINNYVKFPFLFAGNSFKEKYSVNINDAIEAENFILNNYYTHEKKMLMHFGSNHNIENLKDPKKVKKKFKLYNRQYAGYLDSKSDTIVYVGMLNFSNKGKAKKYFEGWKENLMLGSGDWYYSNQKFFIYNKSKKKFEDNFRS